MTKPIRYIATTLLSLTLLIEGCGGGAAGAGPSEGGLGSDSTAPTGGVSPTTVYVDPSTGIDIIGGGSSIRPLKTISYALSLKSVRTVALLDGTYSTATGEVFPLVVPDGVQVAGVDFMRNGKTYPRVEGCGATALAPAPVTVVLEKNASFMYGSATCSSGIAIFGHGENYLVFNSILQGSSIGIMADSTGTVSSSGIKDNTNIGIFIPSSSQAHFFDNAVYSNGTGLYVERGATPQFVNAAKTTGMFLGKNLSCDLRYFGDQDLALDGTIWDDTETNFSASTQCASGQNISVEGIGTVAYGEVPNPANAAFAGASKIDLIYPTDNIAISTTTPSIQWSTTGSSLTAIAIFRRIPSIGNAGVENPEDAIWFWHSGLGGGSSGQLLFSRGRTPNNGSFFNLTSATALTPGRVYYWLIWELDQQTGKVTNASNIGTFRIRP